MIIRTLLVLLSAHAEDQRTEARALREEVKSIEEEELADRSRRGFRTDPRESVKSSAKSISKASSTSKESVKEVTSNGFAHLTIAKEEETKQRTIPPPNRLASYEAEDKIAAEKLLHTTYNREKKTTEAKTSEQVAGMVMITIITMFILSSWSSGKEERRSGWHGDAQSRCGGKEASLGFSRRFKTR